MPPPPKFAMPRSGPEVCLITNERAKGVCVQDGLAGPPGKRPQPRLQNDEDDVVRGASTVHLVGNVLSRI